MLVPNEEESATMGCPALQYVFGSSCSEVSCNLTPKKVTWLNISLLPYARVHLVYHQPKEELLAIWLFHPHLWKKRACQPGNNTVSCHLHLWLEHFLFRHQPAGLPGLRRTGISGASILLCQYPCVSLSSLLISSTTQMTLKQGTT